VIALSLSLARVLFLFHMPIPMHVRVSITGLGFEWLGFDVMVAEDDRAAAIAALSSPEATNQSDASPSPPPTPSPLRAFLIEANTSPDVSHSTAVTKALVPIATADLLALLLDEGHAHDPVLDSSRGPAATPDASGSPSSTAAPVAPSTSKSASATSARTSTTACASDTKINKGEEIAPEPRTEAMHLSAPLLPQRLCTDLFPYAGPLKQVKPKSLTPPSSRSSTDHEATAITAGDVKTDGDDGDDDDDDDAICSNDASANSPWAAAPGFPARPCWQLWYLGNGDELCEGADSNDLRAAMASAMASARTATADHATTPTSNVSPTSTATISASGDGTSSTSMAAPAKRQPSPLVDTEPTTLEALVRAVPDLAASASAEMEVSNAAAAAVVPKISLHLESTGEAKRSPVVSSDDEL